MKGFYIEITNNLLDPKHIKRIGSAVWEFMWCLDKITRIDENGIGWILGGKPVKREDIRAELGKNVSHISENLNKLKDAGYLVIIRTPYGLKIGVNKAQKRYRQKATSGNRQKATSGSEKATSNIRQDNRQDKNVVSDPDESLAKILIKKLHIKETEREVEYFTGLVKKYPDLDLLSEAELMLAWLRDHGIKRFRPRHRFANWLKKAEEFRSRSTAKGEDPVRNNKKPYFWGNPMRKTQDGKWWVIIDGEWKEFAGSEKEIEWK